MNLINFAQKAFIVYNDAVLMIKKSKDAPNQPNKWEVPGGRIEFGETIDSHIKREVLEEVGLEIEIGNPFDVWTFFIDSKEGNKIQVVVVARICRPKSFNIDLTQQTESDYISESKWIPITQILEYDIITNMIPTVKKFLEIMRQNNEE
jgi:8-oxo-dGTP pyrophosphatase MutT (NUDIX family)